MRQFFEIGRYKVVIKVIPQDNYVYLWSIKNDKQNVLHMSLTTKINGNQLAELFAALLIDSQVEETIDNILKED